MTGNGRHGNGNGYGKNGNGRRAADNRARRRRRNRRHRDRIQSRRFVLVTILALVLTTGGVLAAAAFTGAQAFLNSCSLASLKPVSIGENSFVYAADGSLLGSIPAEQNRQPVALDQMSPLLAQATVAIEDRRFYSHDGVDYEGIVRAAVKNIQEGEIVQGGSTLTQQLVRNLYIGREVSWERKTNEACLAIKLEEEGLPNLWGSTPPGLTAVELKAWRKDRILETYLNQVYFGAHAYGAEAAAQTYFSKHAADLELAEAALIAGLPQAPSIFDPFQRPEQALARRNDVLKAMRADDYISESAYQAAVASPIELKRGQIYTRIKEPFFFSYVRELIIDKYGATLVRSGGLKVYTTINPRYQRIAVDSIKKELDQTGDPASAIVSINPKNGAIRAMTAVVPGKKNIQFNIAAQGRRQSGSSFKTFVLTEAIRQGINPYSTQYLSAPFHWQPDPNSEPWDVATYSHSYIGAVPIATATLSSDNTVYARLTLDVGPENVVRVARQMGIKTELLPVASIGLGSNAVSVLEMASAYATLAARGMYSQPMAIRKVVLADGKVDKDAGWGVSKRKRVMSDGVAYEVTRILQNNMTGGTGTGAYYGDPAAAGKTGTTDNSADAWFAGYTPRASTVVWVGYPNAQISMTSVHGITVTGGSFPASIWRLFMSRALSGVPRLGWPYPKNPAVWDPGFRGEFAFVGAPEKPKKEKDKTTTSGEPAPAPTTTAPPPTTTAPPPTTTTGR
ncbi:MAG TPA: transglycosylase domain-containing protein [Gaiellaceae bacterium]|nr:transglycosylase domain-containing protein [Gaiellaceae bacterium]